MIRLRNGHEIDFVAASGALAFNGLGWWWEQPLRILGLLNPKDLTVIAKTVTFKPLEGNLKAWCPWRCTALIPDGVVNAVGLTNDGLAWWSAIAYPKAMKHKLSIIASIMPENTNEARLMVNHLHDTCPLIKGIEVNLSCPNVKHKSSVDHACEIMEEVNKYAVLPIILKLGAQDPYVEICKKLDGQVDAFDLINAVPYKSVFDGDSPLARYDLVGAVSGLPIQWFARKALMDVLDAGVKTPIISGGGIYDFEEVMFREEIGASAFSLGTIFLRNPLAPKDIIRKYREQRIAIAEGFRQSIKSSALRREEGS